MSQPTRLFKYTTFINMKGYPKVQSLKAKNVKKAHSISKTLIYLSLIRFSFSQVLKPHKCIPKAVCDAYVRRKTK